MTNQSSANININLDGLLRIANQVIASNLTTAYFLHAQSGKSKKDCIDDILKIFTSFWDTFEQFADESRKQT